MDWNSWLQYKTQSQNEIVQTLIQEEIDQQTRFRERVNFRCVAKRRIIASLFWGFVTLDCLLWYLNINPLNRSFSDFKLTGIAAAIWLIRMFLIREKNAAKYLVKRAAKTPEMPFSQLVAEDLRHGKAGFLGSGTFHILVCLLVTLCCLITPISDRLSETHVDGMIFKDYRSGCILVNCESNFRTTDVVIPEQVKGKTVIAIDSGAFMNEAGIVSVRIPDTVMTIGAEAFSGCTRLESIRIPESITEIRGNCFESCIALKQVILHDGITDIHGYAFRNCSSLEQITLPKGITEIRAYCFENCVSLKSIVIPEGVTRIGAHAFMGCKALASVTVPSTVRDIGSSAFRMCPSLKTIEIPEEAVVDQRSFKESPTEVIRFEFTEEQLAAIEAEVRGREPDVVYFVYETEAGTDTVYFPYTERRIIIADDPRFSEYLDSNLELQSMENYAEVLDYLEMARNQGAEAVEYQMYTQIGSDIKGETRFFYIEYSMEDMIRHIENEMAGE